MPTIAAIHLSYNKKHKEMELNIRSTYGKSNEFIVDNLSSNLLMYLNREKCRQMLQTHFTPSVVRKMYPDNDRHKRLQMIREMCSTEIHKDRSLNTAKSAMQVRCDIKESGHLFDIDDTPKPTLLQAIKEKISPKQPKCTIPMPTDYKTEEDLQRFREELTQKHTPPQTPLTMTERLEKAKQRFYQTIDRLPENSPDRIKAMAYAQNIQDDMHRYSKDEERQKGLAANMFHGLSNAVETGEISKYPPAMSNNAARSALENLPIQDDLEIDR